MTLHSGAVHEAGHAVMARHLGARLGPIRIDPAEPGGSANTGVFWLNGDATPEDDVRIAAASAICLREFELDDVAPDGFVGLFGDEVRISNSLSEIFPDDEAKQDLFRQEVYAEAAHLFRQPHVRAAVEALANALAQLGKIDGLQAEMIIDPYLDEGRKVG